MNQELKNRLLSFAWRLSAYVVVAVLAFTVENLASLGVGSSVIAVVALIAGELTKYLNKKYELGNKMLGR